jgi:hypothetical protein
VRRTVRALEPARPPEESRPPFTAQHAPLINTSPGITAARFPGKTRHRAA